MKDNKFFAVYGTITAIGILASGFFLFKGWSDYKEQLAEYEKTAGDVLALKKKKLFPNSANLEKKKAQVAEYVSKSEELRDKLLASQRELKSIKQEDFPNILLQTYQKTADYAKSKNIALPENFYFGMELYKDTIPLTPAISLLEWQLDGINTFTNILLESGVTSIDKIERERMDVETKKAADDNDRGSQRNSDAPAGDPRSLDIPYEPDAVLDAYRFELTLTADHSAFVEALNRISNDPNFFYWVRFMRVENQEKQGPARDEVFTIRAVDEGLDVVFPPEAAPVVEPTPEPSVELDPAVPTGDAPEASVPASAAVADVVAPVEVAMFDVREIFGTEKIKAVLAVDIVRFKAPETPTEETPPSN